MPDPSLEHTATLSCSMAPHPGILQPPGDWKGHPSLCHIMSSKSWHKTWAELGGGGLLVWR